MSHRSVFLLAFFAVAFAAMLAVQPIEAATCEDLASLHFPDTTISTATSVTAPLTLKSSFGGATVSSPFCRVVGFLTPTSDSHITFEVWLPPSGTWNHKYESSGNGGFAGAFNYSGMMPAFQRGYATMTTDLGHVNDPANPVEDIRWATGHPELIIDFAYRGEHLATEAAKKIIAAYYGSAPKHSYMVGCSAGGNQAITESLRYPDDYDGYIVGDAGPDHVDVDLNNFFAALTASLADPPNAILTTQLPIVHEAVLKQCAGHDGGLATDNFLTNPMACHFDPKTLLCAASDDPSKCLSPAQASEFAKIYEGPRKSLTHVQINGGFSPGSEMTWDRFFVGKKNPIGEERPWAGVLAYMAYDDPAYLTGEKYVKFSFDDDYDYVKSKRVGKATLGSIFDSGNRNLDPVQTEGGKIIHYHGWDDGDVAALQGVIYYESVVADWQKRHHANHQTALRETQKFYRLFMVPGMAHCGGGVGPNNFGQPGQRAVQVDSQHDTLSALEQWVEHGQAPDQLIASHVDATSKVVDRTRPICPYPQIPKWTGSGSTDDAKNFVCASPLAATSENRKASAANNKSAVSQSERVERGLLGPVQNPQALKN